MSDFYTNLRDDTVDPLIERFGQSVTLTRSSDAGDWVKEYLPNEGRYRWRNTQDDTTQYTAPEDTTTTITGFGVITDFEDSLIDETLIKRGDKLLLSIDLGVPRINDKITVGTTVYNYVNHETVSPGGTAVLFRIQLRA